MKGSINKKVSCIIPAFNESGRIGNVLEVVQDYSGFDEVIVVDDGSSDSTFDEASKVANTKLRTIRHEENKGKSVALKTGFDNSSGEIIVILDADIVGLTRENLDALIEPLKYIDCMTMAYWDDFHLSIKLTGIPIWSGMRAMSRKLFEEILEYSDSGYAIESYMNKIVIKNKVPIYVITWDNVRHIKKMKKDGFWVGLKNYIKMFGQIFLRASIFEVIYQFIIMAINNKKTTKLLKTKLN